eukprot:TRINITY_DN14706_c0_g1_i3.p1 TRINITY_DN14706_c0_g1~~TRINITY_DN14706_c0_g1_i3.p1  ORF type:complete len:325 (+),score=58.44 TRINITY_DN14706_c0_g1_i3:97-1071(+)
MGASIGDALVMAAVAAFLQLGVFVLVPGLVLWALWRIPVVACVLLAVYSLSYFDGAEKSASRKRAWPAFSKDFWLLRFMREYFPQRVHFPKDFPALKTPADGDRQQYLFALHPHGSMSEYRMLLDGQLLEQLPGLQGKQVCWLAASILFRLPVAREVCLWTGCVDASRRVAERMLESGHSVGVIPGGEHEQLLTTYGKEIVYAKKRQGFVKLALRFGVPLVPCYVFGVSDLHKTSKFLHGFRMAIMKSLHVAIPICFGAYGLPAAPFKRPVDIVMGQPLHFEKCAEPTQKQLDEAHAKYLAALQALFDENKGKFGFGERTLILQ